MAFAEAAWKHTFAVGGQTHNVSPDALGRTPTNIISGAKAAYTAGELTTVSTNDTNFVGNSDAVAASTTRRQSHLFRFDIATPNLIATLSNFVNFSHLVNSNPLQHRIKTYIWNDDTLAWFQLAVSNNTNVPRSMTGPVSSPFERYVDGSNKLYILIWDWEGTFSVGGGGCLHQDALVQTPSGLVLVQDIRCGDVVWSWHDGAMHEALVHEVSRHFRGTTRERSSVSRGPKPRREGEGIRRERPKLQRMPRRGHSAQPWLIITVTTSEGAAVVTDEHPIETARGEVLAREIVVGDRVLNIRGAWTPVLKVDASPEVCDVYDVQVRGPNLFLDGVGVNVPPA